MTGLFVLAALAGDPVPAPEPVWAADLSASDGGFVAGGDTMQWEWGTPTTTGPVGSPPCWCTNCDGDYLHDTTDWVELALPDLSGVAEPSLVLHHWYAVHDGDVAIVEVDAGSGFARIDPAGGYPAAGGFVGASGEFVDSVFDLRGLGSAPRVRLTLQADAQQADAGWYLGRAELWDGDILAPTVAVDAPPGDTQDLDGPYPIVATVTDDRAVSAVTLWYTVDGGTPAAVEMTGKPSSVAAIPGQTAGSLVRFWIEATDGQNIGRWPEMGEWAFRVFLAAPTGLTADGGGRTVADEVSLAWDAPVSPHAVLGYQVHREGTALPVAVVDDTSATVPLLANQPQTFWVTAEYDVGDGDASERLALDWEVPVLDSVSPAVGYQGDELYVQLVGGSLYFLQGATSVDLGPAVEVLELDVRDATVATARVRIAEDAPTGGVDVAIDGPVGRFVFPSRFSVRDGSDAPSIRRISPGWVGQGERAKVEIEATVALAGPPSVSTDEDLLITGQIEWDGASTFTVPLVAGTRARPGPHTVTIDDGLRMYTVELRVDERKSVVRGCATAAGARGGLAIALLLAALRRRSGRSR